jgi:hypothetical protein
LKVSAPYSLNAAKQDISQKATDNLQGKINKIENCARISRARREERGPRKTIKSSSKEQNE